MLKMVCVSVVGLLILAPSAWANGRLVRADGWVEAGPDALNLKRLQIGERVEVGALVRTGDGSARFLMSDDSVLNMGANAELLLKRYTVRGRKRKVTLRLRAGRLWARVTRLFGGRRNFEVETANAVAGVRGTEFVVDTGNGETTVTVLTGEVAMRGSRGRAVTLLPNARGVVSGRRAAKRIVIEPRVARSSNRGMSPQPKLSRGGSEDRMKGAKANVGSMTAAPRADDIRPSAGRAPPTEPASPGDGIRSGEGPGRPENSGRRPSESHPKPLSSQRDAENTPRGSDARAITPVDIPSLGGDRDAGSATPIPGSKPGVPKVQAVPRGLVVPPSAAPRVPIALPGIGAAGPVNPVDPGSRATRVRVRVKVRGR